MNGSHISVFMMSVALTYSAPQRKCISRRPGSYTDDSGRIVLKHKNTNNIGNTRNNNNQGNNKNRENKNNNGNKNFMTLDRLSRLQSSPTIRPRKRCCPYDFDSEKCIFVNDRKVCGYDLNGGGPEANPAELTLDVGNGCLFRRGRLECGYMEAPFEGIRRPPVYDRTGAPDQESDNEKDNTDQTYDDQDNDVMEKLLYSRPAKPKTKTTLPSCVQIRKKIVCSTNKL
ncbi:rRNA methyltransferase 1, mitochondrial-like isoform X2 [Cydia pomonella]|uniref:rRNA methyltransferase 1, mitochondrial-like isoform X2 n=1 Tax=Cydia pomonella TaxID=82600 RepID=UPI002ADDEF65|nr:rRNA methyltransferase 1, mitochondrial-like isoform X2 [Cydia pomonella]